MIKDLYGNTRFYGVYRGTVFSADDPLGKSRLRVLVPQILAGTPTQWAWPVGLVSETLPVVGEGVWVQFEGGDPSYPIWQGSFSGNILQEYTSQNVVRPTQITNVQNVTTIPASYSGMIDGGSA